MKHSPYLFLLAVLLNGCLLSPKKKDLNIPDTIAVKKTERHVQVPGSHTFIVPPKGTSFSTSNFILRLAQHAEMRIEEKMAESFHTAEQVHMGEYIHKLHNNPFQIDILYHKKFKLGKDSASLLYGKDRKNRRDEILMVVGSDFHAVMIYCVLPENQPALLEEMLAAIKTVYLDPSVFVDYDASAPFSVDFSNTRFTTVSRNNDLLDYVCPGKDASISKIIVKPLMPMRNMEELNYAIDGHKQILTDIQARFERSGNKKVMINGYRGVESTFPASFPDNHPLRGEKMVYLLYLSNENSSLLYSCYIDAGDKELFETAQKQAHTIRLK